MTGSRRILLAAAILGLVPAAAGARTLSCDRIDAGDGSVIETLIVDQSPDGTTTFTRSYSALSYRPTGALQILFTVTSDNQYALDNVTTILTGEIDRAEQFTPIAWLVNWAVPSLQNTHLPSGTLQWILEEDFRCTAVGGGRPAK